MNRQTFFVRSGAVRAALAVAMVVIALGGCRNNPERELQSDPDRAYEAAKRSLNNGNYRNAIRIYEQLEARFPFSNAAKQSQLDLMYAYYKNREPESAVDQADQFIRENPTHPRVDYAHYIKGLVYFERNANFLERLFNSDLSERPPIDARRSFQSFATLLQQYPQSAYAADAQQRMVFLRNRLADYETHVASYYLRRGAYIGAINRAKYVIQNYDGAPAMREALGVMSKAYTRLGLDQLAADAQAVLNENYSADEVAAATKEPWWMFW
jgi:outer membrane protein assembly factor BamD